MERDRNAGAPRACYWHSARDRKWASSGTAPTAWCAAAEAVELVDDEAVAAEAPARFAW